MTTHRVRPGAVMHDAAQFQWTCVVCCAVMESAYEVTTKMADGRPCIASCCSTTCRDAYVLGPDLYVAAATARALKLREP